VLSARSVARGLPPPVPDHGGLRVETALPNETRRYVFACPTDGLRELAKAVSLPRIFLKLCGSAEEMRVLVPSRWQIQPASYMMTHEGAIGGQIQLPKGYGIELSKAGSVTAARILAAGNDIAASGVAAEADGVFIYDRIVTHAAHRRRGLGRAINGGTGLRPKFQRCQTGARRDRGWARALFETRLDDPLPLYDCRHSTQRSVTAAFIPAGWPPGPLR